METENKTHWKKNFDYRFLSGDELPGEITVEIERVTEEEVFNPSTNSKETALAVYFKKATKGIVLNKTNAKTLALITKSKYIEDWVGTNIILTSQMVSAFGQQVPAIRIKQDYSQVKV